MELKLYNTLTRKEEPDPFRPLDPKRVRMYVCGPTVYDFAHIGNARPLIVFDVLFRLLKHLYEPKGAEVVYVRNITDVDDKINARAAEEYPDLPLNEALRKVTEKTERQFHEDVAELGCLPPTVEPRATEHIDEMKELIERLLKKGYAYKVKDHVLFKVKKAPGYGMLAHRSFKEMRASAKTEVAPKRNPMDFVLWKPSKKGEPGWPSPAGIKINGRPGWHIECSAMSWKYLDKTFDIHGGGIDLVFPHHENELAQSRCAFHTKIMAKIWMHNGFLQIEGEKMAKSLGNFVTIRELLHSTKFGGRAWSGEVLRMAMLQTHYRQPIDWTVRILEQSTSRLRSWKEFAADRTRSRLNKNLFNEVLSKLSDDLNTPEAFAAIDRIVSSESPADQDRYTVYKLLTLFGFKGGQSNISRLVKDIAPVIRGLSKLSSNDWESIVAGIYQRPLLKSGKPKSGTKLLASMSFLIDLARKAETAVQQVKHIHSVSQLEQEIRLNLATQSNPIEDRIKNLVAERTAARNAKNWKDSDRIRDELSNMGVVLEDTPRGTTWKMADQ